MPAARTTSADNGLIATLTTFAQPDALARVIASLARRGVPLVAHIDHAAAARAAGLSLPATDVLIFGDARAGTPLMSAVAAIAIDLPLKLAVQATAEGHTILSFIDPTWMARHHALPPDCDAIIARMRGLLAAIVDDATLPDAP